MSLSVWVDSYAGVADLNLEVLIACLLFDLYYNFNASLSCKLNCVGLQFEKDLYKSLLISNYHGAILSIHNVWASGYVNEGSGYLQAL